MNDIEKEIGVANIVVKKLLGGGMLSEEEERLLREWLEESEEHEELFRQMSGGKKDEEFRNIVRLSDQKEQWQRLDRLTRERKTIGVRTWLAYAAGVVLLLGLGLWFGLQRAGKDETVVRMAVIEPGKTQALLILDDGQKISLRDRDTSVITLDMSINIRTGEVAYEMKKEMQDTVMEYNTIVVPRGGIYSVVLSDGTKVFLNSDSELRYPVKFTGEKREVDLKGEAFFEVTPDPLHPFVVQAGDMRTRVLGTSFNIMAYADEPAIQLLCLPGGWRCPWTKLH